MTFGKSFWKAPVPRWVSVSALVLVAVAGAGGGYSALRRPAVARGPLPPGPGPYLTAGAPLPPLEAAGWVNGPPPAVGAGGPRLLVVDVWADWCPACRITAPWLARLHERCAGRGVGFVSLSAGTRAETEAYVAASGARWPHGYGVPVPAVTRLGAYSELIGRLTAGTGMQRTAVTPTLYVVGPGGRVVWTDGQARPQHRAMGDALARELEQAIEQALAADNPPPS